MAEVIDFAAFKERGSNSRSVIDYQDYIVYDIRSRFLRSPGPHCMQICPLCSEKLSLNKCRVTPYSESLGKEHYSILVVDYTILMVCRACGWWGVHERGAENEFSHDYEFLVFGVAKAFDIDSKLLPIQALLEYSKQKKIDFRSIDSIVFEKFICELLRYEFGPCEVHHVGNRGGSGDGGIDIYLIKDGTEWLVQVKRRQAEGRLKSEPIETVRLLNGVLLREGATKGMLITNAESFSKNSRNETLIKTGGAYVVKLIDRGDIYSMLNNVPSNKMNGWNRFFNENKYEWEPLSRDVYSLIKPKVYPPEYRQTAVSDSILELGNHPLAHVIVDVAGRENLPQVMEDAIFGKHARPNFNQKKTEYTNLKHNRNVSQNELVFRDIEGNITGGWSGEIISQSRYVYRAEFKEENDKVSGRIIFSDCDDNFLAEETLEGIREDDVYAIKCTSCVSKVKWAPAVYSLTLSWDNKNLAGSGNDGRTEHYMIFERDL